MREHHIWIPRRLVYTQAVLLGVCAVTFFLLGLMVGNITAPTGAVSTAPDDGIQSFATDCRVTGQVVFSANGRRFADTGAVVFLLPTQTTPDRRGAPGLVMPNTFEPLDNPTIDSIHQAGGVVVRADADGQFEVIVDQNRNYRLLVVSKNRPSQRRELSSAQRAAMETFFAPSEKLIRDQDFQWLDVKANSERVDVGEIGF